MHTHQTRFSFCGKEVERRTFTLNRPRPTRQLTTGDKRWVPDGKLISLQPIGQNVDPGVAGCTGYIDVPVAAHDRHARALAREAALMGKPFLHPLELKVEVRIGVRSVDVQHVHVLGARNSAAT